MKEYRLKINGHDYEVGVGATTGNITEVTVNGVVYSVETEGAAVRKVNRAKVAAPAVRPAAPQTSPKPSRIAPGTAITSPLPGVMLSIDVIVGEKVKAGQKVAVLEAMKMENDILADKDGTVKAIYVAKGESMLEGAAIMTIE